MKKLSISMFAVLLAGSLVAREFPTKKDLYATFQTKEINRRNWVHGDRESKTGTWLEACQYNFEYATGYEEYKTFDERQDFLEWINQEIKKKGHEVQWIDMALEVSEQIEGAARGNDLVALFTNLGNKVVFEGMYTRLQDLYHMEKPLRGADAKAWDDKAIQFEQEQLVQPVFDKMDIVTLEKITRMAKGEGLYFLFTPKEIRFPGDLRKSTDRITFAQEKLIPYVSQKVQAERKKNFNTEGIEANDKKSMKAAERYLKRLEKENAAKSSGESK